MYKVRNFQNLISDQRSNPHKALESAKSKSISVSPDNGAKKVRKQRSEDRAKDMKKSKKNESLRKREIPNKTKPTDIFKITKRKKTMKKSE